MSSFLSRTSFTTRLLLAAGSVAIALLVIDYVTLLELPRRVASDSVEVALREHSQSFNAALVEEREELNTAIETFIETPDVAEAVREEDATRVEQQLSEAGFDDVRVTFIQRGELDGMGLGAVAVLRSIGLQSKRQAVFYREITDDVLDRAAADAGERVAFAVERDGEYVARSSDYATSILSDDVNIGTEQGSATIEEIRVGDERRHVYSRRLTQDSRYQLSALSTSALEEEALADTRADVRNAVLGMTAATFIGLVLIAMFTSRSVRQFAERVRDLAEGDYRKRLPVHGSDGFADLASSVNVLSTELEQRMAELEGTAAAFRRTLETLEEGICTWDEHGNVRYWNRGAEQLTGIPRERVDVGDPLVAFLRAERTPGTRRVTLPVRRSGAGGLVVDLVVTAMPDGGVLQTFRDTTMADALQQTQRNFMATAAHELRTPITTILGFADTLTNPELDLSERQRAEFLGIVRDQSRQLQQIANAFFTNHQLANERVEVSLGPTLLHAVVVDAIERVERTEPERAPQLEGVTIDVPADLVAFADRRALVGVVSVLVENAIKYGRAPISITGEQVGGAVTLLVRDEGPGIEAHHQSRIFDPFYRIDVDMRSGVGGAGLGLFTARKLVEAMHGVIRVRSTLGSDTTFVLELPAAPTSHDAGDTTTGGAGGLRLVG